MTILSSLAVGRLCGIISVMNDKQEQNEIAGMLQHIVSNMATRDDLAEMEAHLDRALVKQERDLRSEIREASSRMEKILSADADFFSNRTVNHEARIAMLESQLGIEPVIPAI